MAQPPGSETLAWPGARHQRPQNQEARPHLAHDVVIGGRAGEIGGAKPIASAQRRFLRPFHAGTEMTEQIGHEGHIGQLGHVAQRQRRIGKQARGHQRQGRVLGAADRDFALETGPTSNSYSVHDPSVGPHA